MLVRVSDSSAVVFKICLEITTVKKKKKKHISMKANFLAMKTGKVKINPQKMQVLPLNMI